MFFRRNLSYNTQKNTSRYWANTFFKKKSFDQILAKTTIPTLWFKNQIFTICLKMFKMIRNVSQNHFKLFYKRVLSNESLPAPQFSRKCPVPGGGIFQKAILHWIENRKRL
jgi:hypothetical protein